MPLYVANPDTGVVYHMQLVGGSGGPPTNPLIVPLRSTAGVGAGSALVTAEAPTTSVITPEMIMRAYSSTNPTPQYVLEQRQMEGIFQAIVTAYKNQILFNVSPEHAQESAFASLQSAVTSGMSAVGPLVWQAEYTGNGGFQQAWDGAPITMFDSLDTYFGHGMLVSLILSNGDAGTFVLKALHPNSATFVAGSGVDIHGTRLPSYTPNVSQGGNYSSIGVSGVVPVGVNFSLNGKKVIQCDFSHIIQCVAQ